MTKALQIFIAFVLTIALALGVLVFGYHLGAIGWTPPFTLPVGPVSQTSFTRPAQVVEALDVPGVWCPATNERCLETVYNQRLVGNPALIAEVTEIPLSAWTISEESTEDDGTRIEMHANSNKLSVRIVETRYPLPDDYDPFAVMVGEQAEPITTRTHVDVYRLE